MRTTAKRSIGVTCVPRLVICSRCLLLVVLCALIILMLVTLPSVKYLTTPVGDSDLIVEVTSENLEEVLRSERHILMKVYASWCHHCQVFAPKYQHVAELISGSPKMAANVLVAQSHVVTSPGVAERFGVHGYPTVLWIPKGSRASFTVIETLDPLQIVRVVQERTQTS